MSKIEYKSSLATHILGFIGQKRSEGYNYRHGAAMLHLFDQFCIQQRFCENHLTQKLLDDWSILRPGERIRYQSQRVTYVRQLANYMDSIGINTHIPQKLYREPNQGPRDMPLAGPLASYIRGLINQKRASGYKYDADAMILYQFDQFCIDCSCIGDGLPRDLVMKWLARRFNEGSRYHEKRIVCIRQLAKHMRSLGKEAYMPQTSNSGFVTVPHIMTMDELRAFFFEVDHFVPDYRSKDRMAMAYSVLFRLFYCCGLRLNEVCTLRVSDVNLDTGQITIYQSKGNKDRIVWMTDDLLAMCRNYDSKVRISLPKREWFFPAGDAAKPFHKTGMDRRFKFFWERTPYAGQVDREPTIHALRHTFVVHKINDWMRAGGNFQVLLPYLSRYLGHKSFDETYYYYHLTISSFDIIKSHDRVSANVIPEVQPYED